MAGGRPDLQQAASLLAWLERNRTNLALGLGGLWLAAAGAVALKASGSQGPAEPQPAAVAPQQLEQLLESTEREAQVQMQREERWEQEQAQAKAAERRQ
jgi:hypothetical protein